MKCTSCLKDDAVNKHSDFDVEGFENLIILLCKKCSDSIPNGIGFENFIKHLIKRRYEIGV